MRVEENTYAVTRKELCVFRPLPNRCCHRSSRCGGRRSSCRRRGRGLRLARRAHREPSGETCDRRVGRPLCCLMRKSEEDERSRCILQALTGAEKIIKEVNLHSTLTHALLSLKTSIRDTRPTRHQGTSVGSEVYIARVTNSPHHADIAKNLLNFPLSASDSPTLAQVSSKHHSHPPGKKS